MRIRFVVVLTLDGVLRNGDLALRGRRQAPDGQEHVAVEERRSALAPRQPEREQAAHRADDLVPPHLRLEVCLVRCVEVLRGDVVQVAGLDVADEDHGARRELARRALGELLPADRDFPRGDGLDVLGVEQDEAQLRGAQRRGEADANGVPLERAATGS